MGYSPYPGRERCALGHTPGNEVHGLPGRVAAAGEYRVRIEGSAGPPVRVTAASLELRPNAPEPDMGVVWAGVALIGVAPVGLGVARWASAMPIRVDADACPRVIKVALLRAAEGLCFIQLII